MSFTQQTNFQWAHVYFFFILDFSSDSLSQKDIFGHQSDAPGMDCAQICIIQQTH